MQKSKTLSVIANKRIDDSKLANASKIILELQHE